MRIAILTQYFPPETGAPQARLYSLAESLVKQGHGVIILTAKPNYPTGCIFRGNDKSWNSGLDKRIVIHRSWIHPCQKLSVIRRLMMYFSFVISSLISGVIRLPHVDYLITESPPLFLGLSGYVLSRMKRARWIVNVSDLWPDSAVDVGVLNKNSLSYKMAKALEIYFYKKAWIISCQSKDIQHAVENSSAGLVTYHYSNGVDTGLFSPDRRNEAVWGNGVSECVRGIYGGLIGSAQGLDRLLDVAAQVRDLLKFKMILVGTGPDQDRLRKRIKEEGIRNVILMDPVDHKSMSTMIASADIALIPLKGKILGAVPSKIYEAMGSGIPVALLAAGEASQIVEQNEAGFAVPPDELSKYTAALRKLIENKEMRKRLGKNGRKAAEAYYDRQKINQEFIDYLHMRLKENSGD